MHETYDKENLVVDMSKWNMCIFDIEVATSGKFNVDKEFIVKNGDTDITVKCSQVNDKFRKLNPIVFDEEQQKYVPFNESCYVSIEGFPYAEKAEVPINLITCYSSMTKQSYTWGLQPYTGTSETVTNYRYFKTEIEMLKDWLKWFHDMCFDFWTGWNSELFDVPYIVNRIKKLRTFLGVKTEWERALSDVGKIPEWREVIDRASGSKMGETYDIPGLLHHDYLNLYKKFAKHDPLPMYSLNYVTMKELGEGKLDYEGSINDTYKKDWNTFVEYNIKDVMLIVKLESKLLLLNLLVEYSYDTITTIDKIVKTVQPIEGYILKYLHNNNMVMNDRPDHHEDWWRDEQCYIVKDKNGNDYYQNCDWEDNPEFEKYLVKKSVMENGVTPEIKSKIETLWKPIKNKSAFDVFSDDYDSFVSDPHPFKKFGIKAGYCYDYPGRYDNCMSFDITSSYPHHIMQFNISPETLVKHPTKEQVESGEVILTDVNEVGFRRTTNAILPTIIKKVFDERKECKNKMKAAHKAGNKDEEKLWDARQQTKKLTINSTYGVCLTPSFHLYSIDCARAITRCARVTLRDWLSKNINDYYPTKGFIGELEKEFDITFKNKTPLKCENRPFATAHCDTDSDYFCFNEAIDRLKQEGVQFNTEDEKRDVYEHLENIFQAFFNKVLEIRAKKSNTTNKIKFNRENIFTNMFCFAKKLYIGSVIDSEGDKYPFDKPKHKIMGVPIKRSDSPDFCKDADEKLAFDICAGQGYDESKKYILKAFDEFKKQKLEDICGRKSIKEYTKYVPEPIEYYIENGFNYQKVGGIFQSKIALAYNYMITKYKLPYTPIVNGTKFNYLYVKPTNSNNIEAIAFIGNWPKEFNKYFEVDYETMFRKSFMPVIESMFKVKNWIGPKDSISLEEEIQLDGFFE